MPISGWATAPGVVTPVGPSAGPDGVDPVAPLEPLAPAGGEPAVIRAGFEPDEPQAAQSMQIAIKQMSRKRTTLNNARGGAG
jgi:hypothetical protein